MKRESEYGRRQEEGTLASVKANGKRWGGQNERGAIAIRGGSEGKKQDE